MTVVWFLTGLWHGASWNYILWGLYFLAFLLLEKFVIKDRLPKGINHLYGIIVVYFGWVLFKFEDFNELGAVFSGMFGFTQGGLMTMEVQTLFLQNIFLIIFCIIACTDLGKRLRQALFQLSKRNNVAFVVFGITEFVTPLVLLLLAIVALTGASYNPFIYFQF